VRGSAVLRKCPDCTAEVRRPAEGERPVRMRHMAFCPTARGRACEWCGGPMGDGRYDALTCSGSCRAARWKYEHRYGRQEALRKRTNGKSKPSGRQLTQRKAERAVETALLLQRLEARHGPPNGRDYVLTDHQLAAEVVREQLPARQRLAAREQREETTT
jgi:hypothetical protein